MGLWGATSTYIRANEAVGPIFPVQRENTFAVTAPPEKPPALETNCSYPVIPIQTRNTVYSGDQITDWGGMPPLLVGPKYIDTDGKNGFVPPKPVAEKPPPTINFPIVTLGVTAQNKFLPTLPPKIDSEKVISYPMLPIEEHGSKYTTQEFGCSGSGLKLDRQKILVAPGNRDVGDRHACLHPEEPVCPNPTRGPQRVPQKPHPPRPCPVKIPPPRDNYTLHIYIFLIHDHI